MPRLLLCCSFLLCSTIVLAADAAPSAKVQYAKEVLPILSTHCFNCHGPDAKNRKADLRLDTAEGAQKKLESDAQAIVPGDVQRSELVARIYASDDTQMPPKDVKSQPTAAEKELLKRWIATGAEYQSHWSFAPPKSAPLPVVQNKNWPRNPIDRFILAELEKQRLTPNAEADRYTLARRVALDLTGLPPTVAQADAFAKSDAPDAFEKYVDQLLASPAFGEHWAHVWLDLARYADSNGFADDRPRTIWKYRDWVIEALNANLPFDQFTIEQLAGDLLPNATNQQILATAFHRNTLTNDEGGTNDEEFRVAAVLDRVITTMEVWMGMTMNCAQCHDHKFDPITQQEFYRVYAIFNQTEDSDKSDNTPLLSLASPEQEEQSKKLTAQIAAWEQELLRDSAELNAAQKNWEGSVKPDSLPKNMQAILKLDAAKRNAKQSADLKRYFRSLTPDLKATQDKIAAAKKELAEVKPITTPVMRELPEKQRRKTHVLLRGDFLNPSVEVTPGTPGVFPALPKDAEPNRLTLAKWLVDGKNPLTARVTVNRFWEQIFGQGLVDTPEDFGMRGAPPTHPELLDWLANEFVAQKWDVKKLLKLLVTSAAYRQSSQVTPDKLERDPRNRWLSRGPRFRGSAEIVRDQALAAAGLLSTKMYGPPARPPRPKLGLAAAFGGGTDWADSAGPDRYRRALYTEWRRTTPYPSMVTFDAPSRNVCALTRPKTNTPLQALVTLNDPVYIEAAQALARRMVKEGGTTPAERVTYGFRQVLIRPPQADEVARLVALWEKAHEKYAAQPEQAVNMATVPLGPLDKSQNAADLAAWTLVSNVLLNLDETLSKR